MSNDFKILMSPRLKKDQDITITSLKGGIQITANGNGQVKISAPNILLSADNDIDIQAGQNVNINAKGGKVEIGGAKATVTALLGNLPEGLGINFAKNAFAGSFVGPDFLADKLGGALPELADVGNTFSGKFGSPSINFTYISSINPLLDLFNKVAFLFSKLFEELIYINYL